MEQAIEKQNEMEDFFRNMSDQNQQKMHEFFEGRRRIVNAFEQNIVSLPSQPKDRRYEKYAFNMLFRDITEAETNKNIELFHKYFNFTKPSLMLKVLKNVDNKEKNNDFVNIIKSGLNDLKDDIKNMSLDEKRIEQPNKMADNVEEIYGFNTQDQKEEGLKILTPDQMLSSLPISLAQLKTGNN